VHADPPEPRFDFLGEGLDWEVHDGGPLPEHDVAVYLDFCEPERAGPLAPPLARHPSRKLVVDHHVHEGPEWWDAAWRDPAAAATGLLVRRIARALGVELDQRAAQAVFTSLATDTGWFHHPNTDAEVLRTAAELVERGVDAASLYRRLRQRRSPDYPARFAALLERTEYSADGRLALLIVPGERASADAEPASDDALDLVRAVEQVEVVLLLREVEPGRWRLSARSKTDYDVSALARRFGGGGHRRAAGAELRGAESEVRARLLSAALEGLQPQCEVGRWFWEGGR
jgi:phosphoesterase RecJ-like protein